MARGVEKSLRAVILEARDHPNLKKIGFVEALFFRRSSESKGGGGGHSGKWRVVRSKKIIEDI